MPELFELFILPDKQAVALSSIRRLGFVGMIVSDRWLFEVYGQKGTYHAIYRSEFEALAQRTVLHMRILRTEHRDPQYVGYEGCVNEAEI